jgi:hypothetical protein
MRDTVSPSCRAIEYPPPTFLDGATVEVGPGRALVDGSNGPAEAAGADIGIGEGALGQGGGPSPTAVDAAATVPRAGSLTQSMTSRYGSYKGYTL